MRTVIHVLRKFEPAEWGGIETHLIGLVPELEKLGWRSEVHAPRESGTDGSALEAIGARFRTFRALYPTVGVDRRGLVAAGGNLVAPGELARLSLDRSASVYHAHTLRRLGGVVRTAARLRKIPYAVTLHGPVRTDVAGIAADTRTRSGRGVDLGAPFGFMVGARTVVEDADLVFVLNRDEEEAWRADRKDRHLARVAHGVDGRRATEEEIAAARAKVHGLGDAPYLLVVARLDPAKGHEAAIEAFLALERADLHLVLVGAEVDRAHAQKLRELARGVANIHFVGGVRPREARALIAGAELMMVPSRSEPFGIVLLEAWAEGTPALFSGVGGLVEIARTSDALWGLVDDRAQFPQRLAAALADREGLRREAEEGPVRVGARWSWASLARATAAAYESATRA